MADNEKNKLKNAIGFYMIVNNLKYATRDNKQSLADQVYGAMILATAINSEYNKVESLGTTLRMILLGTMDEYYREEFIKALKVMENGASYTIDTAEYNRFQEFGSKYGKFAFECTTTEYMMEYFFEEFLAEENIQTEDVKELYNIARNYGLTDKFGNDEKKNFEIFRFYYLNRFLKKKVRSGWDSTHWNVSSERIERISEHVVGTIALATALDSEFDFKVDIAKVITALCVHEIGEISIGDITPFDGITPEEKKEIEHKAMAEILGNLKGKDLLLDMLFSFDEQDTFDSKFAHYCDKLEADIQAKVYQDMGYQHSLDDQEGNVVFKSSRVQQMIRDGATTAFDIWYEWDKGIYTDEPVFTKTLQYVRDNKLK